MILGTCGYTQETVSRREIGASSMKARILVFSHWSRFSLADARFRGQVLHPSVTYQGWCQMEGQWKYLNHNIEEGNDLLRRIVEIDG